MKHCNVIRGGSRAAATSKMELFVIIVNGFQPLTIITKCSILDVAAVLDPPLVMVIYLPPFTFMSNILAENIFHESYSKNRTQDCDLITCK